MASKRFVSLKRNIASLEKRFLPKQLNGPFTARQHDLARGFRLLAHAEIEAFLEDRAREVSMAAFKKFLLNRKPNLVTMSLLAFEQVQSELSEGFRKDLYSRGVDHVEACLKSANQTYQFKLSTNHGIRERNILQILLPIGFNQADIDSTWLGEMDSFGRIRGETAHTSFAPQKLVDPKTEQVTVSQLVVGLEVLDKRFSTLLK